MVSLRDVFKRWAFVVEKRKVRALLRPWFKRWAFEVEKRKALALLDRIEPYQHLDTEDEYFDDMPDYDCEEGYSGPIVAYIKLPRAAG